MNDYQVKKEEVRELAKLYQREQSKKSMSWGDLAKIQHNLTKLAKRFGLIKEFKENGII